MKTTDIIDSEQRHDYSVHPQDSPLDVVFRMKHLRPAFELRAHWNYNNLVGASSQSYLFRELLKSVRPCKMYMLGSYLVEKYSDMTYTQFVKERIFRPLNMKSTTYVPSEAANTGKTTQTWTGFGRRLPWWFTDDQVPLNAGAGGVISNALDMASTFRRSNL